MRLVLSCRVLSTQLANAAQDDTAGARARSSGIVHTESDAALARDARPLSAKQRKAQGKLVRAYPWRCLRLL